MTIHRSSRPKMPHVPHGFRGNTLVAVIGGAILLGGLVAAGLRVNTRSDSSSPAASINAGSRPAQAAGLFASTSTGGGHTVYIARSEQQAATVMTGIDEANAIRSLSGEPLLMESAVVAGSEAEAAAVTGAFTDGNRIFAGLGLREDTIVDLRQ